MEGEFASVSDFGRKEGRMHVVTEMDENLGEWCREGNRNFSQLKPMASISLAKQRRKTKVTMKKEYFNFRSFP